MQSLFYRIQRIVQQIGSILLDRVPPGGWPWVYRGFHWLAVIAITALLGWYSHQILKYFNINLQADTKIWFIDDFICGWIFAAAYGFVRTVIFAIGLFSFRDTSEFPDIDEAWDRGLLALDRLGYDVRDVPVFAVLGTTPSNESAFFAAAGIDWKAVVPAREEDALAPLRLYLSEKALFVALSNVGAYARQLAQPDATGRGGASRELQGGRVLGSLGATQRPGPAGGGAGAGRYAMPTMTPQQYAQLTQAVHSEAAPPPVAAYPSAAAQMTLRPGMLPGSGDGLPTARPTPGARSGLPAPLEQSETALGLRRLSYFLRLLTADREPFCGINGLMTVLPVGWSAAADSGELLNSLKEDVRSLHTELRQSFPIVALLSDMESVTGFRVFLERMRRIETQIEDRTRAGTRCPMGAVLDRKTCEWVVDKSVEWFRDWIFRLFAVTAHDGQRGDAYRGLDDTSNRELYSLLCTLQKRRTTLWRQLELVFKPFGELPPRFSGYYFVGKEPSRAFLRSVLQKLEDEQNEVAYLPSSCRRDRRLKAWATLVVLCGVALLIADAFLAWQLYQKAI